MWCKLMGTTFLIMSYAIFTYLQSISPPEMSVLGLRFYLSGATAGAALVWIVKQ